MNFIKYKRLNDVNEFYYINENKVKTARTFGTTQYGDNQAKEIFV